MMMRVRSSVRGGAGRAAWRVALVGLVLAMGHAADATAEPVGSPASILKKGKWIFGLITGGFPARKLDGGADTRLFQIAHYRGYGLTDWLSLYGKLGVAYMSLDDPLVVKEGGSTLHQLGANLLSGGQVKVRILKSQKYQWEWDGSIQYTDVRLRSRRGRNEVRFHDWQFATSLAKSLGKLKPYVGIKYSSVDSLFRIHQEGVLRKQVEHHSENPLGFFVGTDVYLGQYEDVVINVESGYVDGAEVAVAVAHYF